MVKCDWFSVLLIRKYAIVICELTLVMQAGRVYNCQYYRSFNECSRQSVTADPEVQKREGQVKMSQMGHFLHGQGKLGPSSFCYNKEAGRVARQNMFGRPAVLISISKMVSSSIPIMSTITSSITSDSPENKRFELN